MQPKNEGVTAIKLAVEDAVEYTPSVSWPEIVQFDENYGEDIPASLLPGPYGDFAAALSEETETPTAMAVMTILGIAGLILSPHMKVHVSGNYSEPVNLYILIALKPGNRKSQILRMCLAPLVEIEQRKREEMEPQIAELKSRCVTLEEVIKEKRKAAAKAKEALERDELLAEIVQLERDLPDIPVVPQFFATDTTPEQLKNKLAEQKGVFGLISDEGGITDVLAGLYTGGQANADIILQGHDGGNVRVERKDKSVSLNPLLTFVLSVQPVVIQNMAAKKTFAGKGLVQRFLYGVPKSNLGSRNHNSPPMPEAVRASYNQAVHDLYKKIAGLQEAVNLTLSLDAMQEWQNFRHAVENMLKPGGTFGSGEITGWGSKLCGAVVRLAAILHVMEHGVTQTAISKSAMEKALELAAILIRHAEIAFGMMSDAPENENPRSVWDYIASTGKTEISRQELSFGLRGRTYGRAEILDGALKELIKRGFIREERRATAGRTGTVYLINPAARRGANGMA